MEIDVVGLSIELVGLVLFACLGTWAFVTKRRPVPQGWRTYRSVSIFPIFMALGFAVSAAADVVPVKGIRLALRLVSFGFFVAAVVVTVVSTLRASRRTTDAV